MTDPRTTFPDNIYHTLTTTNNDNEAQLLKFNNDNSSDIVRNPYMYYLLIQKFVLSNKALPIFFFDNSDNKYLITIDNNVYPILMENTHYRGSLTGIRDSTGKTGEVYFINQFLDMINKAFVDAGTTNVISIRDDERFEIVGNAGEDVYFSRRLYDMFPTLEATFTGQNTREYHIHFRTNVCTQESKALYAWNDIRSILVISQDLPILQQGYTTAQNAKQKLKILNEFPPIYSQSSSIDKTDWVFESDEYHPIDLISQEGISSFTFDIKLVTKFGKSVDYKLLPGESASLTFRFVKRALFNNEYNLANETARIKQNPQYSYHKY